MVLIVPYWNWNKEENYSSDEEFRSNCTLLELKYTEAEKGQASDSVLIVPYWNWNGDDFCQDRGDQGVLIVPYWNWNSLKSVYCRWHLLVLIVPYWNWNVFLEEEYLGDGKCSNCTLLELKSLLQRTIQKAQMF